MSKAKGMTGKTLDCDVGFTGWFINLNNRYFIQLLFIQLI